MPGDCSLCGMAVRKPVSAFFFPPLLFLYVCVYVFLFLKPHLIGECYSAEDYINSIIFSGNIQKTV